MYFYNFRSQSSRSFTLFKVKNLKCENYKILQYVRNKAYAIAINKHLKIQPIRAIAEIF